MKKITVPKEVSKLDRVKIEVYHRDIDLRLKALDLALRDKPMVTFGEEDPKYNLVESAEVIFQYLITEKQK